MSPLYQKACDEEQILEMFQSHKDRDVYIRGWDTRISDRIR